MSSQSHRSQRHTTVRLSTRSRQGRQPDFSNGEDGTHHLVSTIVVLTAALIALSVYTILYSQRAPARLPSPAANRQAVSGTDRLPDTPLGLRTFTGDIRESSGSRVSVRTFFVRQGKISERTIAVALAPSADIVLLSPPTIGVPTANASAERQSQPADRSALKSGRTVQIYATDVIDNRHEVTAERIEIIR